MDYWESPAQSVENGSLRSICINDTHSPQVERDWDSEGIIQLGLCSEKEIEYQNRQ